MIVCVIPAAGLSKRFPGNKLVFRWNGKSVIRWTVENVLSSSIDRVVVVLGYEADRIRSILNGLNIDFVYNPDYGIGMSSSIKQGVKHVIEKYGKQVEALVITPGDAAWIPPEVYDYVIEAFREYRGRKLVFVAAYNGRRGHPILFDAKLIPEILSINEETRGLKRITRKYYWDTMIIELPYPGIILDLDTYNDLNRVKYLLKK